MWLVFAAGSAFFAGLTSILAKCGIRKTDSTVATALRTIAVLIMAILMTMITGSWSGITNISGKTWLFLVLSGLATGGSWLCYFRALQVGDVNKVVPVDKSSTVLTMALAFIFLNESISPLKCICMVMILAGTLLMIEKKKTDSPGSNSAKWLPYAILSAVFAALTSILGKIGIDGVSSDLGTAIRTAVVLVMAWLMVPVTGKADKLRGLDKRELLFIALSGLATGGSWLCYYKALQDTVLLHSVPRKAYETLRCRSCDTCRGNSAHAGRIIQRWLLFLRQPLNCLEAMYASSTVHRTVEEERRN